MKKVVFCLIPLIMILMGCASAGPAVAETSGNSPGMDLDAAIREVATQMEVKIPSKTMVALVSVASPSTAFSTQVLTRLESAIVSSGKLVVVDRANLDKVREEQGFQLSGEVDDESAKSIGKLLGAGAIVKAHWLI
jgi:curli biogenesis system outer membrane secretion channel CsgG